MITRKALLGILFIAFNYAHTSQGALLPAPAAEKKPLCGELDKREQSLRLAALFEASRKGNEKAVEHLIKGAPVSLCDYHCRTPLMIACGKGHAGVAAILLRRGAKLDATDGKGKKALEYAQEFERDNSIRVRLDRLFGRPSVLHVLSEWSSRMRNKKGGGMISRGSHAGCVAPSNDGETNNETASEATPEATGKTGELLNGEMAFKTTEKTGNHVPSSCPDIKWPQFHQG